MRPVTRAWKPRPFVYEYDGGSMWAGVIPDGPIVHLDRLAALALEVVIQSVMSKCEEPTPVTTDAVLDALEGLVDEVPPEAQSEVESFMAELERLGLVEATEAVDESDATEHASAPRDHGSAAGSAR